MTEEQKPEDLTSLEEQLAEEPDELTLLGAQLEEALREKDQYKNMAQRAQADLVNYRRRAAQELSEARENANSQLLLKLISVADDFNRAFSVIPEDAVAPGWYDGLKLVHRSLQHHMESEGLTKIETAIGQPFDVHEHEAVFFETDPDNEEGSVVRVIRDGYKLHQRVLRAAQVSVSKAAEQEPEAQKDNNNQEAQ
ncbi:MAG: nucleotide exchange factor GrpE [Chloroflexi bacterium]|nr:nucleotide exchange factor GrpE [Chloroflexota bacterium]